MEGILNIMLGTSRNAQGAFHNCTVLFACFKIHSNDKLFLTSQLTATSFLAADAFCRNGTVRAFRYPILCNEASACDLATII
jgi:hypothetical protein